MIFSVEEIELVCPRIIEPGSMLWERKHSQAQFAVLMEGDPYTCSSQYQQAPTLIGGGLFKVKYFKTYDLLPADVHSMAIFCDTAQKTKEHNDYTVFAVFAYSPSTGIYLVDLVREKFEAPMLESSLVELWEKHKPTVHKPVGVSQVFVEDKSSGSSLIQSIKNEHLIPIDGIQRNVDKVFRAMGAVKYLRAGFVHLPNNQPWVHDYKDEFRKFTPLMTHKHDDQIDPTMDAIEYYLVFERGVYSDESLG